MIPPGEESDRKGDPAGFENSGDFLSSKPRALDVLKNVGGKNDIETLVGNRFPAIRNVSDNRPFDISLYQVQIVVGEPWGRKQPAGRFCEAVPADFQNHPL